MQDYRINESYKQLRTNIEFSGRRKQDYCNYKLYPK